MWAVAAHFGKNVMIGDAQKGVAELRPEARYNRDAELISDKFSLGVDLLDVIAEAAPNACTTSYPVMETLDRFAWHMKNVEGVAQVITLPIAAKIVNAGWNEGNLRWRVLPRDSDGLRQDTQGFETDSGLLNQDCSAMPVMMFLTDHRATTIDRVVTAVKEFRDDNKVFAGADVNFREQLAKDTSPDKNDKLNLRLATGNVGVFAAINDEVRAVDHEMLWLLYAAVFLMCLLSFRNPLAALCIVLPLVLVTELGHSLMVYLDIGKKVNTLTRARARRRHRRRLRDLHLRAHARIDAAGPLADRFVFHRAEDHRHRHLLHRADARRRRRHVGVFRSQIPGRHGRAADLHVRGEHDRGDRVPAGAVPLAAEAARTFLGPPTFGFPARRR